MRDIIIQLVIVLLFIGIAIAVGVITEAIMN